MPTNSAATRRLALLGAALTLTCAGGVALATVARAADAGSRVWVCTYTRTAQGSEVLRPGPNPVAVEGRLVDDDQDGRVHAGDQVTTDQARSVVVEVGGQDPGTRTCSAVPPPPADAADRSGLVATAMRMGADGSNVTLGLMAGGMFFAGAGGLLVEAERRRREARPRSVRG